MYGSGLPLDSALEGHSLWDLASITPGLARSHLLYIIDFIILTLDMIFILASYTVRQLEVDE